MLLTKLKYFCIAKISRSSCFCLFHLVLLTHLEQIVLQAWFLKNKLQIQILIKFSMNPNIYLMLLKLTSWVEGEVAGCAIELTCKMMGVNEIKVNKLKEWEKNYLTESWIEKIHRFVGEAEEPQMGRLISLSVWFSLLVLELLFSSQLRECSPAKIGK